MPAFIDYKGKKIGRVTILEFAERRSGNARWKCQCDCGFKFISWMMNFKKGEKFECNPCRLERKRGIDLTGRKFGRWTVISRELNKLNKTVWNVKCDCGNVGKVSTYALGRKGKSMSCGCLGRKERSVRVNHTLYPPKHNTSKTNLYRIRMRIVQSCYNPKNIAYKRFGAKGYKVCELWINGALDFFNWCKENGWKPNHIVAIKEGHKIFSPENCYIISEGQFISFMNSKKITINGVTKSTEEWAKESKVSKKTIDWRLLHGYSPEEAVTEKSHARSGTKKWDDEKIKSLYLKKMSCSDIAREMGFRYSAIVKRIKKMNLKLHSMKECRKYKPIICEICKKESKRTSSMQKYCLDCKGKNLHRKK